ncbi:MAG TPA: TetR/AcrR family transcriptional regulator [Pyrinomonadaceae bacterium]|jgi:AcrR family transcriptional regulator|nr:TetR/AcrR family transcriptional regulator [Pyrinomonadaceae bacterium]
MKAKPARSDVPDLILDAADRLLARYGYRKMTVDDLAQEAGVGKGTIYLHFAGKEEVALSRIDRVIDQLKGRLRALADSTEPAPARVRRMLLERVLFRFDNVQHYTGSLDDIFASIRPGLLTRRERHFADEAQIFAGVLKEGRRAGVFAFRDPRATAHALLDATNSLLPYSLSKHELGDRKEVEAKTGLIAQLLVNGLLAPGGATAGDHSRVRRLSR